MAIDVFHDRSAGALARLGSPKTVLLETRRRDGTWVPTPVSLVIDAGRAYFRTYDASGKYKRLRNFPQVRLARTEIPATRVPSLQIMKQRSRPLAPSDYWRRWKPCAETGSYAEDHSKTRWWSPGMVF